MFLLNDSLSSSRKLDYYTAIINLLWKSKQSSPYTALAGLLFISIEESLKPLVWQEACKLIREYGFRFKNNQGLEDLELTCLSLILNIPNIQKNLNQEIEIKNEISHEAKEAFSFLLSLVQNARDLRKPVWTFYRIFGSGPGKWHTGQFEDLILSANENIFSTQEFDPRQRISGIISKAIKNISDLDKFELISKIDSDDVVTKLKQINADFINPEILATQKKAIFHNRLINTELLQNLWGYAQSEPKEIIEYIHSEIKQFYKNFPYYYNSKRKEVEIDEDWGDGQPEIYINSLSSIETGGRYVFFKPFRDFIRDIIYNSIWVIHGIENETASKCSQSITLVEDSEYLSIEFKNLTSRDVIRLYRRAYHTRIHALYGDFKTITSNGIYSVILQVPSTSTLFPNGGLQ